MFGSANMGYFHRTCQYPIINGNIFTNAKGLDSLEETFIKLYFRRI